MCIRDRDWVNLTELLDESVAEYAHQVPSGVELLTNYPAHDSLVELDKLRIKQILSNFLSNALKNTTTGHVEVFYEVDHQSVRIGVKDTGKFSISVAHFLLGRGPIFNNKVPPCISSSWVNQALLSSLPFIEAD